MKQQILYTSLAESIPKRIGTKKDWPATFSNAVLSDLLRKKFMHIIVVQRLGNNKGRILMEKLLMINQDVQ